MTRRANFKQTPSISTLADFPTLFLSSLLSKKKYGYLLAASNLTALSGNIFVAWSFLQFYQVQPAYLDCNIIIVHKVYIIIKAKYRHFKLENYIDTVNRAGT